MNVLGIRLLGFDDLTLRKLALTFGFVAAIIIIRQVIVFTLRLVTGENRNARFVFWSRQGLSLLTAVLAVAATVSIWFDNPERYATAFGLLTAGFAFALQKVVTSLAGYIAIMRGTTFSVGDRITMGGVRGDVISLGFIQTTILEMGQPPDLVSETGPAVWVHGRQYTGRLVTVTNDKVFETPVYNYTREFPFLWEEMHIPISFKDNRVRAEEILLAAAKKHTLGYMQESEEARERFKEKYFIELSAVAPKVYYRITDNWVELSLRFLCREHGVRELKDAISRDVLSEFDKAGIGIASGTYEIVGFPPIRLDAKSPLSFQSVIGDSKHFEN